MGFRETGQSGVQIERAQSDGVKLRMRWWVNENEAAAEGDR